MALFSGPNARVPLLAVLLTLVGCTAEITGSNSNSNKPPEPLTGGGAGPGPGPTTADCNGAPGLAKPRIWRLTHAQLANTLRDAFSFVPPAVANFPSETRLEGFANRALELRIAPLLADSYYQAADELAGQALSSPAAFGIGCAVAQLGPGACLSGFITTTGEKLWRRPLSEAEVTSLTGLFTTTAAQGDGPSGGVKAVIQALFMSPGFLHRSELGTSQQAGEITPLTDYELASALSYTLWETAPDAALLSLAKQGKLHDPAVLAQEAKRLLAASDQASAAFNHFMQQWMHIEDLPLSDKDMDNFPLGTLEVAQDLAKANQLFVNSVLFDPAGDRSFKTLFSGSYGFVNERTAPLYGLTGVQGNELLKRDLNPNERRGIFSMPGFMWSHATSEGTSLVERGAYLRAEVLCDPVPAPPGVVQQVPEFAGEDATGREKFALHSQPACVGCHKLFDSLGFAMESYDAIGRYRTMDKGKVIDPSGTVPLPSDPNGEPLAFSGFVDMIGKLAEKPDPYNCFSTQYLTYTSGQGADTISSCEKQAVIAKFKQSGYQMDALILGVIASPSFAQRQN